MNIILCLDDGNGILFNNRRLSRDEEVCSSILELAKACRLRMNAYSAKMFSGFDIIISEKFLQEAEPGDFCFVEDVDITPYRNQAEKVYVYRWNRKYPADRYVTDEILGNLKSVIAEFPGKSHSNITLEVYSNEEK